MAKTLYVEIVAPDRMVFRGDASRFGAPGVEGAFEVLYNHAALIAATEAGKTSVTTPEGKKINFATGDGFVEVLNNRVIMVVEFADPASEIDVEKARAAEEAARERLNSSLSPEERAEAEAEAERARNKLRAAIESV